MTNNVARSLEERELLIAEARRELTPEHRETAYMVKWDILRQDLLDGCTGSGPRDAFESFLDAKDELIERLLSALGEEGFSPTQDHAPAADAKLDLDALEKVARAATQAAWQQGRLDDPISGPHCVDLGQPPKAPFVAFTKGWPDDGGMRGQAPSAVVHSDDGSSANNAAHIATFDPPTVLALISSAKQAARASSSGRDQPSNHDQPLTSGAGLEGWQDIETAPKDGTAILITRPTEFISEEGWHVVRFGDADTDWPGLWVCHDGKFDTPLRGADPTHWQPLPPPPMQPTVGEG